MKVHSSEFAVQSKHQITNHKKQTSTKLQITNYKQALNLKDRNRKQNCRCWADIVTLDVIHEMRYQLEALKGSRGGQYSIRINDQWRVCFRWSNGFAEDVEIVDYHFEREREIFNRQESSSLWRNHS